MAVTYATARAACVARYGEPPSRDERPARSTVAWAVGPRRDGGCDFLWLECAEGRVVLTAQAGAVERVWTLAGDPTPDAPAATLPDALDAADAFLRTHGAP